MYDILECEEDRGGVTERCWASRGQADDGSPGVSLRSQRLEERRTHPLRSHRTGAVDRLSGSLSIWEQPLLLVRSLEPGAAKRTFAILAITDPDRDQSGRIAAQGCPPVFSAFPKTLDMGTGPDDHVVAVQIDQL